MSKESIKKEEGFRSKAYSDTKGHKTIGSGLNIDDPVTKRIVDRNKGDLNKAFDDRYKLAESDARIVHGEGFYKYPEEAKSVAVDMSYNMGRPKYSGFKKHISAMQKGDYSTASKELMNSRYAKEVPSRAKRNADILKSLSKRS